VGEVRVRYLGRAPRTGGGTTLQYAAAEGASPRSPATTSRGEYWVQAGSYSDRHAARRVAEELGARATVDGGRNDGLFRVMVGPWPDPDAAERSRQAVIARGYADALLISAR
jgi:rare lipoprotein A